MKPLKFIKMKLKLKEIFQTARDKLTLQCINIIRKTKPFIYNVY